MKTYNRSRKGQKKTGLPGKTQKFDAKLDYINQRPLTRDEAFECINEIFEELQEDTISEREFNQLVAKINFSNDLRFTLKEIKDFISKVIYRQEILLVSIYWIGWSVDPNEKKNLGAFKRMTSMGKNN